MVNQILKKWKTIAKICILRYLKDGDGETFRLQQTCDALQKLENETKHYETVRKKYKRYHDFLSKVSV